MYTAAISLYFNSKLNINCTTYIYFTLRKSDYSL